MRAHFAGGPVSSGGVRTALCSSVVVKPAPNEQERSEGIERGTSRIIYVRCRECVRYLRMNIRGAL